MPFEQVIRFVTREEKRRRRRNNNDEILRHHLSLRHSTSIRTWFICWWALFFFFWHKINIDDISLRDSFVFRLSSEINFVDQLLSVVSNLISFIVEKKSGRQNDCLSHYLNYWNLIDISYSIVISTSPFILQSTSVPLICRPGEYSFTHTHTHIRIEYRSRHFIYLNLTHVCLYVYVN